MSPKKATKSILNHLQKQLADRGFRPCKINKDTLLHNFGVVEHGISVAAWKAYPPPTHVMVPECGLYLQVSQTDANKILFDITPGHGPEYRPACALTKLNQLLNSKEDVTFFVEDENELAITLEQINGLLIESILPFFDGHATIRAIDELVNDDELNSNAEPYKTFARLTFDWMLRPAQFEQAVKSALPRFANMRPFLDQVNHAINALRSRSRDSLSDEVKHEANRGLRN